MALSWRRHWVEILCLAAAVVLLAITACDYTTSFAHEEVYDFLGPAALERGPGLHLSDWQAVTDPRLEGNTDRPRFYNWLFWVLNTKLRVWLFQYLPFHPTVCLTWLFSFALLPWAMYKLLARLTGDAGLALQGTALLLVTQGFLSGVTMYFHAAKPMTLLFITLGLLCAERLRERAGPRELAKWLGVIVLSLFWDELYYAYFLVVPIFFPEFLRDKKLLRGALAVYGAAFAVFCLVTLVVLPPLIRRYSNGYHFDFLNYAFFSNTGLRRFVWSDLVYNTRSLLSVHLDPFSGDYGYYWTPGAANLLILGAFAGGCVAAAWVPGRHRALFRASLAAMAVFIVFQHLVVTRREGRLLYGSFYWGAPFSVFFVIWFAALGAVLDERVPKAARWLRAALFVLCACAGLAANRHAAAGHVETMMRAEVVKPIAMQPGRGPLTFAEALEVWRARHDPPRAAALLARLPKSAYWLYFENQWQERYHP